MKLKIQCEIEEPVAQRCNGHADGSSFKGPDLGCVDPGDGSEGQSVDYDQQVAEGDDGVGFRSGESDWDVRVAADAAWDVLSSGQKTSYNEMAGTHGERPVDEEWASASPVDVEEHNGREDDEQSVLHTGSDKVDVAGKTSHGENVYLYASILVFVQLINVTASGFQGGYIPRSMS